METWISNYRKQLQNKRAYQIRLKELKTWDKPNAMLPAQIGSYNDKIAALQTLLAA